MNPSLHARIAVHTRWSRCDDRVEATRPAREAFLARFERQVDPDGVLPPSERQKRAESAKRAYMAQLSAKRWAST